VPGSGVAGDDDVRSGWGCVAAVDGSPQVAEPLEGRACERAVEEDVGGVATVVGCRVAGLLTSGVRQAGQRQQALCMGVSPDMSTAACL